MARLRRVVTGRVTYDSLVYNIDIRTNNQSINDERFNVTVKELIELLSTLPDLDDEVVIEVDHGDLRDIVSRKVTKEKVNNHGTIVCDLSLIHISEPTRLV